MLVISFNHSADRTDGGSTVTITACAERGAYRVIQLYLSFALPEMQNKLFPAQAGTSMCLRFPITCSLSVG
ncbi:protein of unknown function [Paenibacillus alvei]|uniref:Uncharacterized protein n=1 Tax=Paenibacillus alvei TaxID=44250 RepID=A0A383RGX2_PAEAL|nr:protein of unknown function [Paenibacillus alvei]